MKWFKKLLLFLGILLFVILLAGVLYVSSAPELPPGTSVAIEKAMTEPLPDFIVGDSGSVYNDGVRIWYEVQQQTETPKGSILLAMGIGLDALAWPDYFVQPLVDSGYQVIRYDHRGLGLSDWMEDFDQDDPYTLSDMGDDAFAVLDELGVEKAHLIGVSMGGMVVQQMAVDHPERVLTLTSLMSTGFAEDPNLPTIGMKVLPDLLKLVARYGMIPTERNTIKLQITSRQLLQGPVANKVDFEGVSHKVLFEMRERKGYNSQAVPQQLAAVSASGSRYEALEKLTIPTLLVHGTDDPLIPIEHSQAIAELLPAARTLWVEGMGHGLPKQLAGEVLEEVFGLMRGENFPERGTRPGN